MTIKSQLIESFIKGVGKSIAAITVFGVIGGIYYVSQTYINNNYTKQKHEYEMKTFNNTSTQTQEHDQEETEELDSDIESNILQMEEIKPVDRKHDYKKIFSYF